MIWPAWGLTQADRPLEVLEASAVYQQVLLLPVQHSDRVGSAAMATNGVEKVRAN